MLVLLPPSEGKTRARSGRPVDLDSLSLPALTPTRQRLLDAAVETSGRPDALRLLGVGASLADEVARGTRLRDEPAQRVSRLYSGVLYDALDYASLPAAARRRADRDVLVVSALWGALHLGDRVPAYRVSHCARLVGAGEPAAEWRGPLRSALAEEAGDDVVLDCRSSSYVSFWRPARDRTDRLVSVRVLSGGRVVSHDAKRTRGLVVRHLLARGGRSPRTPEAVVDAVGEAFDLHAHRPTRPGTPWVLDVQAPR